MLAPVVQGFLLGSFLRCESVAFWGVFSWEWAWSVSFLPCGWKVVVMGQDQVVQRQVKPLIFVDPANETPPSRDVVAGWVAEHRVATGEERREQLGASDARLAARVLAESKVQVRAVGYERRVVASGGQRLVSAFVKAGISK